MKIFEGFNQYNNAVCGLCGENTNKKTCLIPIDDTDKDGIEEAEQIHLDCLRDLKFRIKRQSGKEDIIYVIEPMGV